MTRTVSPTLSPLAAEEESAEEDALPSAEWSAHAPDTEAGVWSELKVIPGSSADLVVVAENPEEVDLHYE